MKTLGEILKLSTVYLEERGVGRARRQAEELLSHILHKPRIELYMEYDRILQEDELIPYRAAIKRKGQGEPWQYIVGEVTFLGCLIEVNPSVLIPRQETEILVSKILDEHPQDSLEAWDLCCGSGCIGIALKKNRPSWKVTLSDLSSKALDVAQKNCQKNEVEVSFLEGDLLLPFEGLKADLVVCNPPYVKESEFLSLEKEVRDFEPKEALVGGKEGIEPYKRLAQLLPAYLNPGAKVFLELGAGMGDCVLKLFSESGWKNGRITPDWSGHDRFFSVEFE